MVIQNLVLEVTRRCNMACEHCLRGDAQNMDMSKEIIDEVLKSCNGINSVTFAGGEPSLNISIIRYFFEQAEKLENIRQLALKNGYVINFRMITEEEMLAASEQSFLCKYELMENIFKDCISIKK